MEERNVLETRHGVWNRLMGPLLILLLCGLAVVPMLLPVPNEAAVAWELHHDLGYREMPPAAPKGESSRLLLRARNGTLGAIDTVWGWAAGDSLEFHRGAAIADLERALSHLQTMPERVVQD